MRFVTLCFSVGLAGCASDPPGRRADLPAPAPHTGHDATIGPMLVANVPSEVASGSWLTATVLAPGGVTASVGDHRLDPAHPTFPIWRLPSGLAAGAWQVVFTDLTGAEQPVEVRLTEPWFVDVAIAAGLGAPHQVAGWPGGCAQSLTSVGVADIDLDGDLDLLQGNLMGPSRLFLNVSEPGRIAFVEADPEVLGSHDLVTAVQFADWDNDGDPDLFLGRRGENRLLRNDLVDGVRRFVDVTDGSGLGGIAQRTTSGAWGDFDGDGDLDLYEVNHAWCIPTAGDADHRNADHLFRNQGGGTFQRVTGNLDDNLRQVSGRFGFAALWLDYDRDGTQDLWVVNDFVPSGGRSVLWRTVPVGVGVDLVDVTLQSGIAPVPDAQGKAVNAMGGAVGDLNRDGLPDFAYSNIGQNFLMFSTGPGRWEDVSAERGVERTVLPWGQQSITWGTHLLDLDNDGDLDVWYVGGTLLGSDPQPHAVFENVGEDRPMVEVTWTAGLASPAKGAASAQADLDGDGWLDVVVANWGGPMEVWHNKLGERLDRHWLVVDLEGDGVAVNRDAFGAVVELERLDGTVHTCWRNPMPSMASTGDAGCHFGLGQDTGVLGVTVTWPDGVVEAVSVDAIDTRMRIRRAL